MLPRILIATALALAPAPVLAQNDFESNGHAGPRVRIGRPGIRVHEAWTPPREVVRVHSTTRDADGARIPTHGVSDAFAPSRIPVKRIGAPLPSAIRVHGLADELRPSRIRVHGVANP
jgi:hypothetical protein